MTEQIANLTELTIYSIAVILATRAVLRAWFYGSLFEKWLGYFERRPGLLGDLLTCPFCLSYHVVFWLFVAFYVPSLFFSYPNKIIWFLPAVILASISCFHSLWGINPEARDEEDNEKDDKNGSTGFD